MKNFKLVLQYDGTRYNGWQKQGNTKNTIQGKLEALLGKLFGTEIEVFGSGRTDAGVHALGQTANFRVNTKLTAEDMLGALRQYLPKDIAVLSCEEVPERFHARLNAKAKTYLYRITVSELCDVFSGRFTYHYGKPLNARRMREAAKLLIGTHDFRGFSAGKKTKKSTVRTIHAIEIREVRRNLDISQAGGCSKEADRSAENGCFPQAGSPAGRTVMAEYAPAGGHAVSNGGTVKNRDATEQVLEIEYRGDGFLYNMVRILTGTLIEIGDGRREADSISEIFASGDRQKAGYTAPAGGLFLKEVFY